MYIVGHYQANVRLISLEQLIPAVMAVQMSQILSVFIVRNNICSQFIKKVPGLAQLIVPTHPVR